MHAETQVPLMRPSFLPVVPQKGKGKKRVKIDTTPVPEIYQKYVMSYIDRITIWNALLQQSNASNFVDFIESILEN